eukprot:7289537-Pyramimonas_sp.AAC.1
MSSTPPSTSMIPAMPLDAATAASHAAKKKCVGHDAKARRRRLVGADLQQPLQARVTIRPRLGVGVFLNHGGDQVLGAVDAIAPGALLEVEPLD